MDSLKLITVFSFLQPISLLLAAFRYFLCVSLRLCAFALNSLLPSALCLQPFLCVPLRLCAFAFNCVIFITACSKPVKPAARAYPITVTNALEQEFPLFIESIGNVYSLQLVQIRPQVGGIIIKAFVAPGQYVKQGEPLYSIDPRPYQAALEKAKATLAKDEATLKFSQEQVERNKDLVKKDYVSKLSYEQFESQVDFNKALVESDKAEVSIAALNLEWSTPVSPIDGKISTFIIDPGNLVVPNDATALTDVRQITPIDIRFNITQEQFIKVQKSINKGDLKFTVFLPQEPENVREGEIYFIDNNIDRATGTILLRGKIANEDERFWPGEFVRVRLILGDNPKAVVVPSEAVKIGQEGHYVYIYHDDTSTVEYRKVVKGDTLKNMTAIDAGVNVGEVVVVKGQNNLLPNAKVQVISAENKAAPIPEKVP